MRGCTREELTGRLTAAGFTVIAHLDGTPLPADRMMVAVSRRG